MTAAAVAPAKSRAETIQRIVTPGGVEAWLVESYAVPLVALEFAMRGGAAQDPSGKAGLSTMLAGLLDEGAGPYDSRAFHRAIEDLAIRLGFGCDRDTVSGHLQTLSRNIDPAFELLRLALCEARLDEAAIDRVRGQIIAGLRRDANDPDALVARAFRETAFPDHPYGRPVRGEPDSLESLTRGDLEGLRGRLLATSDLKIGVVGAIDAETLARKLDLVFGALPRRAQLDPVAEIDIHRVGERRIVDLDVPQSTIRFGRPGMQRKDKDYFGAVVVNHILGGGVFTARLFNEVREKRGLAYSVYSHLNEYDHCAMVVGGAATKNERARESLDVIQSQFADLGANGPTADELDKAKKYLTGSYALRFDTSTKIASQLVNLQLDGFEPSYLDERNARIDAVTMEDARRVAKRLLGDGELLVSIAGRPQGL
ncbi:MULTISPECIES: M16 family metallopeptidase [Methylosinus]|uniref:Insulinase family protein n=1 Tax=Methylosinus trichosporium (strain ATCC 35070 / NCIMB 11131 / UNIQEM 75 / OB3b) TaxID=595536 RepID=A0A2D2CZ51_METT3|nr:MULTISPECIES: pitrilysin family protein [Methylosinus]ATQ68017.1 insulinase family protein [Methylosinus trichosporium OB3b]OBS53706.1 zinc protease [Methylosinus sp. 3S-1]